MRRIPAIGTVLLAVVISISACGGGQSTTSRGGSTAVASHGATGGAKATKGANAGKQSTDGKPANVQTPPTNQPGNPCSIANSGLAFEAMYGGTWRMLSDDNPPESGEYKQRECVFEAKVPGMYQGNNGPAYVKVKVVTFIDDVKGSYFEQLVQGAKSKHAYYPAQSGTDGTAGANAFYDGDPGSGGAYTLTTRDELDPVIIIQVVPVSDQYKVFYNDVNHYAALVDTMHYILEKLQP